MTVVIGLARLPVDPWACLLECRCPPTSAAPFLVIWGGRAPARSPACTAVRGNCGRCEFREVCGGSRSRSFASTGALMGSDRLCVYDPGPDVRRLVPMFASPIAGSGSG